MDDILTVADRIEMKIAEMERQRGSLKGLAEQKARAISNFAKRVTKTELKLKNGLITEWEGIRVGKVAASTARKIAEGMCWFELNDKEEQEALYKAKVVTLESIRAELNGLQSISKHLE